MIESLLSTWEFGICKLGSATLDMEITPALPELAPSGAKKASYRIPNDRLKETADVDFVYLTIEPVETSSDRESGGYSDCHSHPGDELVYILEGEVTAVLSESSMSTVLRQGDWLLFHSEQEHQLFNFGNKQAHVFIIRFYQLSKPGTRQKTFQAKSTASWPVTKDLLFLHDIQRKRKTHHLEVCDRVGFGHFLGLISETGFASKGKGKVRLRELAERGREAGLDARYTNEATFSDIHHGKTGVPIADVIPLMKKVYQIEPVLVYDFLSPVAMDAIVVRKGDWIPVPEEYVESPNAQYLVPRRRLAFCDISISKLHLKGGSQSKPHRHPGHELLLLLSGDIKIIHGINQVEASAGKHLYAHFLTQNDHYVKNASNSAPSELLVIRFYE